MGAQYVPANDPAMLETFLEQHSRWSNAPQKPAINVEEEVNKLNSCKSFSRH